MAVQHDSTTRGEYYNGLPTVKKKTHLAVSRCAGIMIGELSPDTNDELSLLAEISKTVNTHDSQRY